MTVTIAVLYGSVRESRQGINVATFLVDQLKKRKIEAILVDPKQYELPLLDKMHKEYPKGEAPKAMQEIHKILTKADGFIMVSAEYNHSVPAALKNMLDHFQSEYFFKPCGICTYSAGPFGGVRVAPHLRGIAGELGMVTPSVMFGVSAVGKFKENVETYERRVQRFLDELEWYANTLKEGKKKRTTPY